MANVCCTCASIISPHPLIDAKTEKALENKRLDCCGRLVCAGCISKNPRFASYCPFCQTPVSLEPASQAPPAYTDSPIPHTPPAPPQPHAATLAPPAYDHDPPSYDSSHDIKQEKAPDVIHYLSPDDSITSLSLAYRVPIPVLRQYNSIWSDHLLTARKMILIPGHYYQGPSLAPDPVEDEVETERKAKIRRLMTSCKIHEYDVAVLYLEQEGWDFEGARERWVADERWERENPMMGKGKGKGAQTRSIGRRLATRS